MIRSLANTATDIAGALLDVISFAVTDRNQASYESIPCARADAGPSTKQMDTATKNSGDRMPRLGGELAGRLRTGIST